MEQFGARGERKGVQLLTKIALAILQVHGANPSSGQVTLANGSCVYSRSDSTAPMTSGTPWEGQTGAS